VAIIGTINGYACEFRRKLNQRVDCVGAMLQCLLGHVADPN
jgi:hypothetical protein